MCLYLRVRFGQRTGVAFISSTPLAVYHNRRLGRHRVFAEMATRGYLSKALFEQLFAQGLQLMAADRPLPSRTGAAARRRTARY
jgi:hypothetical protein